jgi:hypothetical protein
MIAAMLLVLPRLSAATFLFLSQYDIPTSRFESFTFTTTSEATIAQIRHAVSVSTTGRIDVSVEIAPGTDGINRNFAAPGAPFWKWRAIGLGVGPFAYPTVVGPTPWLNPFLRDIDADVEGYIESAGARFVLDGHGLGAVRVVEIDTDFPGQLVNVSTRGVLGTGDEVLIAGFIIQGTTPRLTLIRVLGPTLVAYDVPAAAADPQLRLFRGQTPIAQVDNWDGPSGLNEHSKALIPDPLKPSHIEEAAVVVLLEAGAYTVHGSSAEGGGIGLIDVFDLTALK